MSSRRAPAAAACAATTPTFGRGLATTFLQCRHLLDLLDSGANPHLVGEPFDIWCQAHMLPWVLDHIHMDSDLVRRWQGGDVDVSQRLPSDLILSAAAVEPRISEPSQPYLAMRALPSCLDPVERRPRGHRSHRSRKGGMHVAFGRRPCKGVINTTRKPQRKVLRRVAAIVSTTDRRR
jgi:hypothetical protein